MLCYIRSKSVLSGLHFLPKHCGRCSAPRHECGISDAAFRKKKDLMRSHSRNAKPVHTFILQFERDLFDGMFPQKQISRGHLITRPPRSPDLTPHFLVPEVRTRRCLRSTTARKTRDSATTFKPGLQTYGTRAQDERRHSLLS
jgi:hypothetical protein